jgi:hypothetical protein
MSFDQMDDMHDEMLHGEFRSDGKDAAPEPVAEETEGPRGLSRFRTATMVGAGGLACAAIGAFFGGLGGSFTIDPTATHSVASSNSPEQTLAATVNQAYGSAPASSGPGAAAAASFSPVSGPLTRGIAAFQTLMGDPSTNLPVTTLSLGGFGIPGATGTAGAGTAGVGGGGVATGCTSAQGALGVSCILDDLTSILGGLGTAESIPSSPLDGLAPTLAVSEVTGTLSYLNSLVPVTGLPTTGLPTTGLPTGLPTGGLTTTGLPPTVLGLLAASVPATAGGGSSAPLPGAAALAQALSGVGGSPGGSTTTSTVPSLPLPPTGATVPSVPSLPVTTPSGSLPAPATVTTPSSSGSSTVNVPLPALPVPVSTPTISGGGISVGMSSSGSTSGLTLTMP